MPFFHAPQSTYFHHNSFNSCACVDCLVSASNDAAHLLNEARQAMLLARVGRAQKAPRVENGRTVFGCDIGPSDMTPRDALRLATRGGAGHDPVGALLLCARVRPQRWIWGR